MVSFAEARTRLLTHATDKLLHVPWNIAVDGIDFRDSRDGISSCREYIRDGHLPVIYGNHESTIDLITAAMIAQRLCSDPSPLTSMLIPYAVSAQTGGMGSHISSILPSVKRWMLEHKQVEMFPVRRGKDQADDPSDARTILKKLFSHSPTERHGLAIYPQTNFDDARRNEGELHFHTTLIDATAKQFAKSSRPMVFLPFWNDTRRILGPDEHKKPGLIAASLLDGIINPRARGSVTIGAPFTLTDLLQMGAVPGEDSFPLALADRLKVYKPDVLYGGQIYP